MKIAMLLSCDTFESFFEGVLGFTHERYVSSYRHDFAWYYGKGLLENGIRPIIYIPSLNQSGLHETETGISVRFVKCAGWYRLMFPFTRACRITKYTRYAQQRINAIAIKKALEEALVEDGMDLLYIQEYWCGRFDQFAGKFQIPIAAADHGGIAAGRFTAFKRETFKHAAALYCQTQFEVDSVGSFGATGILCTNGTDTSYFTPPSSDVVRTKTILTVARLTDKQKRTSDLIRSMVHLNSEWTLNIVGTGPDREMLDKLVAELGVGDRVKFLGFRGRGEVRGLLQTCGVYAMPSANEGLCLAVLEAMACGAATVTSRIYSFESLIEDGVNGYLVPVSDPPALAKAIEQAWQNRDAIGPRGVQTVADRFDSRKLFRQLAHSLRAAAAKGAPTRRFEEMDDEMPNEMPDRVETEQLVGRA
jgi:glycosyltransferase involved in cell wall biosynthesis